ncbi:iron-enterobactin ABC transporter permease [Nonomuraea sp. KC401]|uniref:FecCD family ABC transporter permease n=1 Tax=unclassified Nonomuraea TaxID=2593643 RepID=UPI0010FCDDC2|nr:iron chelate uptake ABC transporter family permease subunit [Nonomuraea sp. KC401]NBE98248.1 iron chelate uptake ABC transporter family permease subunit [Nonomuraea sp. K271]TLF61648.1 iron-enterobactin ABC transporter permease [Nonomuraea sp. KC401]
MSGSVVLRAGAYSVRAGRRTLVTSLGLLLSALGLGVLGLCLGGSWTPPQEVLAALAGQGDSVVVVREWRLPRVAAALVFGAALGLAGAVFQNLTRNPLGSPDVIGLDAGSYTGALFAITVLGGTSAQLAAGSVAGGLLAAAAVYALSLRSGLSGMRLVVVGIAVNAMLTALNSWIVLRAELDVAIAGTGWSAGSLNGVDWDELVLPCAVVAALALLLAVLSPGMHQAALGDELAVASGVRLNRLRLLLVLAGVGCTATVTAVAGPIVFISLAAPQIGRLLTGSAGVALGPAALSGAVLLPAADLAAQFLLAPVSLPVGVVTTVIGGCYLIGLLVRRTRRGTAA